MSRIVRGLLLPHLAGSRRSYSFFSNSGGGRSFTAAKTPKVLAPNTKTSANKGAAAGSSTTANPDAPSTSSPVSSGSDRNVGRSARQDAVDELPTSSPSAPTCSADAAASHIKPTPLGSSVHVNAPPNATSFGASQSSPFPLAGHPQLKPHELKLHHFFSLHRPYLLLDHLLESFLSRTRQERRHRAVTLRVPC